MADPGLLSQRPYSKMEVSALWAAFVELKRLSHSRVRHRACSHSYRPRRSSVKELLHALGAPRAAPNCSVCFMQDHIPSPVSVPETESPETVQQLIEFMQFYNWVYTHID